MASVKYTVKSGETLSGIASANNTSVNKLLELNPDIKNKDLIYAGQVIVISGDAASATTTKSQKAKITALKPQNGTDRNLFATWAWSKDHTENYKYRWKYGTGDGVGFIGSEGTTEYQYSIYGDAPENATHVAFQVKPISKKYKSGKKEVSYWTADWSTVERYYFKSEDLPSVPEKPTVTISSKYKMTVKIANKIDDVFINATSVQIEIVKSDDEKRVRLGTADVNSKVAQTSFSCTVDPGTSYKVRCRGYKNGSYSEWSEYSDVVESTPSVSKGFYLLKVAEITSDNKAEVHVNWYDISSVAKYELQYTTVKRYFDSADSGVTTVSIEAVVGHAELIGLTPGFEYFFRVRGISSSGKEGAWSDIASLVVGVVPEAPTTWSLTTTATVGEDVRLYWLQNTADGSEESSAIIEIVTQSIVKDPETAEDVIITSDPLEILITAPEETVDRTHSYKLDTSSYTDGVTVFWRVKTAGVMVDADGNPEYSEWSMQRVIDIYAQPTLVLTMTDSSGTEIDELTSLPLYITAEAGPNTQTPLSYYVKVISDQSYETVDNVGNPKIISYGDAIYSGTFDSDITPLTIELSPSNITLENNARYKIECTVTMNSGLSETQIIGPFTTAWTDDEYWPDAEISYDPETFTTAIKPYCNDENGNLIGGVTLSVYRREFDGSFTELIADLDNVDGTYITDPHPALDYARYRIVARSEATGAVSYYNVPGYPTGETAVIIQWDEQWSNFDIMAEDPMEQPVWTGSLLRLPYNIDISDGNTKDVEHVLYIGRENPVSYYGTQIGHSSTWNMEIEKSDAETLYGLRRLARWMGDVYVREPSGSGYWASVDVSISQKHTALTIPVALKVTRVEGGK